MHSLKNINTSFKDVTEEFKVSPTTIANVFDDYVDIQRGNLTEVLSVDEVYSKHTSYTHYCFHIYSPQLDKVLDILPSRKRNIYVLTFLQYL